MHSPRSVLTACEHPSGWRRPTGFVPCGFDLPRQRRSIVSVAEYENDRDSLKRMLTDFETDYLAKHKVSDN